MKNTSFLYSRSRSQLRFKISIIVHPDNIFRTVEPCATKLGIVMWRVRRAGVVRVALTDWRIHWLTHRHTQKLTHSPIHNVPLTYWHTHWLTLCHTLRLPLSQTDTLTDILSQSHIYYHIATFICCHSHWLQHCQTHRLTHSLIHTLSVSQNDTLSLTAILPHLHTHWLIHAQTGLIHS